MKKMIFMTSISTLIKQIKYSGYGYSLSKYNSNNAILFIHNEKRYFENVNMQCLCFYGKTEIEVLSKALDEIGKLEVFGGCKF
jgi:hypothetical protein